MKIKLLTLFLVTAIAYSPTLRPGAEGPEREPDEQKHLEYLEEEKTKYEDDQETLRQEAQGASPADLQQINAQQAVIAQELKDVEAQLAAVPQVTQGTTSQGQDIPLSGPTREQITQAEKRIVQSTTIGEWQRYWQKFSQEASWYWPGSGGELHTAVAESDRAAAILDVVKQTPSTVFSQNMVDGVKALTSLAQVTSDFLSKDQVTQDDYDQIMTAIKQKLSSVIESKVAGKTIEQSLILLGPAKAEEALLELGGVGTQQTVWDLVTQGLPSSTQAQARNDLLNFVSQKMVEVFRTGTIEISQKGIQDLSVIARDLIGTVTAKVEPGAQVAVGDKFVNYITAATADEKDPVEIVELSLAIYGVLEKLDIPDQTVDRIRRKMMERINVVINEIPEDIAQIDTLLSVGKTLGDEGLLKNSPTTLRLLSTKMNTLVTSELTNHTFVADEVALRGSEGYGDAYQKEIDMLKRYMDFVKDNTVAVTPAVKAAQLDAAKRIMRITDFLNAQQEFRQKQEQTIPQRVASSILGIIKGMFASEDAMTTFIKEQDPGTTFLETENAQRNLFSKGVLEALPEDILVRMTGDFTKALKQAEDAKTSAQAIAATNALLDLYSQLQKPLIRDGSKAYGFKDLLANQQDLDRYDALTRDISTQVVKVFTGYVNTVMAPSGNLGPVTDTRKDLERMLETMRGYLSTEFAKVTGAPELAESIDKILQATQQQDIQAAAKLIDSVTAAVSDAAGAELAKLASDEFKQNLDGLVDKLESFIEQQKGLSSETITRLTDALNDAQTWRDIASAADSYKTMIASSGPDITATQAAYLALNQSAATIASSIDYRQKTNWQERKTQMTKQADALTTLAGLFTQQKVGQYTLTEIAAAMEKAINFIEIPDDMQKFLVEQGYFVEIKIQDPNVKSKPNEPPVVIGTNQFAPGVKGHLIVDMARENAAITARQGQLQDYVQKNPQPPADMLVKGRANKLASDLKLSQLILDDQLSALKQEYNTALQNPLMQTAIRIEQSLPLEVNTVEEATKNAASLLGLTEKQVTDPAVLGKQLGLSAETVNDPTLLAQALNIKPDQMNDKRIIGAQLGLTSEEIAKEPAERFSFSTNETVRIELMQRALLSKVLQEKSEQMAKQDTTASITSIAQIGDILAELGKQTETGSADAYFEAMIALKPELLRLSPADAAKWSQTDRLMSVMGALDGSAILALDPLSLTQQMKDLLTGTGALVKDGLAGVAVQARRLGNSLVRGTGKIVGWASIPVGVLTAFLTSIGIRFAWSAGTTAIAGAAGTVMGPVAGIGTYLMAPGPGFLPEVVALFTGTGAGYLMSKLGHDITEISESQLAQLNEDLVRRGFEKIEVTENKSWAVASKEWVTNLFKSAMVIWSETAASKKSDIQHKTDLFVKAKTEFYDMLGLPPTASDIELQAALAQKEAQLQLSWGLNRWLAKRQYNNAYRYMLRTGFDVAEANINYMTLLNQMATKVLAAPAERSQTAGLGYVYERGREFVDGALKWFRSMITGTIEKPEEGVTLKPAEFDTYKQQIDDFYQQQVLELQVLKDQVKQTPDVIRKASPFDDDTYVNVFQSLIDGRISDLQNDYEQGLMAILTEHGIKVPAAKT